jgi:pimeloyl-ACP methyl ester carboxylesterase
MKKNLPRRTTDSCAHNCEGLGSRSRATAIRQSLDWPLIRRLADYSNYAYRNHTASDNATDAQALISPVNDGIVVAFRGSSSPQDFLQDAKFDMEALAYLCLRAGSTEPSAVRVHRGFLEDFDALNVAIVSQVRTWLQNLKRNITPQPKIYITGHSLGGALAVLCAFEFARQHLPVRAVVTFGQPRVGNAAFRDLYNAAPVIADDGDIHSPCFARLGDLTYHVINANDPVPLAPPLLFGYRDEGNEIFLPRSRSRSSGGYVVNPSIGFTLISDVLGALDSWRHRELAFIPNHLMKAYLERIQLA